MTTPSDMTDLISLAERCERASGPNRSVDAKIALAVLAKFAGWIEHPANNGNLYGEVAPSRDAFDEWLIRDGPPCLISAPVYTASIDAAMTLVPAGHTFNCGNDIKPWAHVWFDVPAYDGKPYAGRAETIALALCASALRALASHSSGGGE